MQPKSGQLLSVAICTHNPRADYMDRTLQGLRAQTLAPANWELIIIDNASKPAVAETIDLSWHPNARIIVETELGIMVARLRALKEFRCDLLVFLDDDNVLAENYLDCCLELFARRPDLGAASGCIMPEYESPAPDWFEPYESWIAVRRITTSVWSNFLDPRSEPVTAGMCLRKSVALAHVNAVKDNPTQRILGSRGTSLMRGEDVALAKIAMKNGYTVGQFTELKLLHLIAKRRSDPEYLFSLYRHLCASGHLISWVDDSGHRPIQLDWRARLRAAYRFIKGDKVSKRLVMEEWRGYRLARNAVKDWRKEQGNLSK
jgi:glycosyltransferase involved in cell wall biosynthesis